MGIRNYLNGSVRIEFVSADPTAVLSSLYQKGFVLENITFHDELTVRFSVQYKKMKQLIALIERRTEKWKIVEHSGLYWKVRTIIHRPVLTFGLLLLIALSVLLPTRVLFFCVEGNTLVPDKKIIDIASGCGVYFGASRRQVRSEKVKNTLLSSIPELEWVGINTSGCVATISVRERQIIDRQQETPGVTSIVAVTDGIIQELTVTAGSAACKPGQAVNAGQVLISGYTDCGLSIRAQRAKGEVYATTKRLNSLIMPEISMQKGCVSKTNKKYYLLLGKKRINFFQSSGNLDGICDKMYVEEYVTLPGGFQLPVAIVTETYTYYENADIVDLPTADNSILQFSETYLLSHMVAGRILSRREVISRENGWLFLDAEYECLEMIGRERSEEIIKP